MQAARGLFRANNGLHSARKLSSITEGPICYVFPGQGSQVSGMGRMMYENHRVARDVFEEADEALNMHLSRTMFDVDDPSAREQLKMTENAQPAILVNSIAALHVAHETGGWPIPRLHRDSSVAAVMGHSLGEYTACWASGVFDLPDVVRLVRTRGQLMQQAVGNDTSGRYAMHALMPIGSDDATVLVKEAEKITGGICDVANINSPKQIVVSGEQHALESIPGLAKSLLGKRIKAVELSVSAPFHSRCMQHAQDAFFEHIAETPLHEATVPIISNVNAGPVPTDALRELLVEQITATVRWSESIQSCEAENDIENWISFGVGANTAMTLVKASCQRPANYFSITGEDCSS